MQEANKLDNIADRTWYELLVMAFNRFGQNARKTSKELGIPFTTMLHWLKQQRRPERPEEVKAKLLAYFAKPYVSGQNPVLLARVWQTMRCMRQFSVSDLVALTGASENYCRQVAQVLRECGYLKLVSERPRVLMLAKDTGPKPPTINRERTAIIDNNLNQQVAA